MVAYLEEPWISNASGSFPRRCFQGWSEPGRRGPGRLRRCKDLHRVPSRLQLWLGFLHWVHHGLHRRFLWRRAALQRPGSMRADPLRRRLRVSGQHPVHAGHCRKWLRDPPLHRRFGLWLWFLRS